MKNDAISVGHKICYVWESDYKKSQDRRRMVERVLESV